MAGAPEDYTSGGEGGGVVGLPRGTIEYFGIRLGDTVVFF